MSSFCRQYWGMVGTAWWNFSYFGYPVRLCGVHLFVPAVRKSCQLPVTRWPPRSSITRPFFGEWLHRRKVSGSRRTELTRSCQGPPLKNEWQKVGSNSGPTAPEARTLPILHASLPHIHCDVQGCHGGPFSNQRSLKNHSDKFHGGENGQPAKKPCPGCGVPYPMTQYYNHVSKCKKKGG